MAQQAAWSTRSGDGIRTLANLDVQENFLDPNLRAPILFSASAVTARDDFTPLPAAWSSSLFVVAFSRSG